MSRRLDVTSLAGGIALVGIGVLLLLDANGHLHLGFGWLAPLLIGALGLVLVASGAAARPRGSGSVRQAAETPGGNRHRPTTREALRDEYRLGVGSLHVDLTAVELSTNAPTFVRVRVAIGEATVLVPANAHVKLTGRATMGRIDAFDERDEGIGVTTARDWAGTSPGGPRLELDVSTAIGQVGVARGA